MTASRMCDITDDENAKDQGKSEKDGEKRMNEKNTAEKMDMFDEARAIQSTMKLCHLTQSELASRLGVSQSYVANKLRLLSFSGKMAEKIKSSGISERHARSLLRLSDEAEAERILCEVSERSLTVRECEELVDAALVRSTPRRLGRASALDRIDDLKDAIAGSCEFLRSQGIEARTRSNYLGPDLYITIVVKNA